MRIIAGTYRSRPLNAPKGMENKFGEKAEKQQEVLCEMLIGSCIRMEEVILCCGNNAQDRIWHAEAHANTV